MFCIVYFSIVAQLESHLSYYFVVVAENFVISVFNLYTKPNAVVDIFYVLDFLQKEIFAWYILHK